MNVLKIYKNASVRYHLKSTKPIDRIPDNILDEMLFWGDFFRYSVCYNDGKGVSFYEYMTGRPRYGECLKREFQGFMKGFYNPDIVSMEIVSMILGTPVDDLEEFLDHRRSVKSSGKVSK